MLYFCIEKLRHYRGQSQPETGPQKWGLSKESWDVWSPYFKIITKIPLHKIFSGYFWKTSAQ